MQVSKQTLPKSQIELTFELTIEDLKPFLEQAAEEMTTQKPLEGFRPGKVPFEIVKQRLGEMAILQAATNAIIGETFYDELEKSGIETVDQPKIDIVKMAPNNPFVYKATVSVLPQIELCDYKKLSVKPVEKVVVKKEEVEKIISDLQKMRAEEKPVDREVQKGDKLELNFETIVEGIAIPGGKAEKYSLLVGEGHMIPGFEDNLIGLKKDEEKTFELAFPKDYHNAGTAGKLAKFTVKVLSVAERVLPEVNDDFAKSLGLKKKEDLEKQIEQNVEHERSHELASKKDLEIINLLIEKNKYNELPDSLINDETHKMIEELKDNVKQQGLLFDDYLNHLKKKEDELRLDLTPDAIKRVKTALAIRQIAITENLSASHDEIHAEIDKTLAAYKLNPMYAEEMKHLEENVHSEAAHRYFANLVTNRKVMDHLRKTLIKE